MPSTLPWLLKTVGAEAVVTCAAPPVACAYTYGRPWPTVALKVCAPSAQYGVTVQSDQPSTLVSGEFRPATPRVRSRAWV